MLVNGKNQAKLLSALLLSALLAACGDTTPDLDVPETYDNSPLQFGVSTGGSSAVLEWEPVEGATEYRLTQTDEGEIDVLPDRLWIGSVTSLEIDTRSIAYDLGAVEFLLESRNPADLDNPDWQVVGRQNGLNAVAAGAELRFSWVAPDDATEFRLTQVAGDTVLTETLLLSGSEYTLDVFDLSFNPSTLEFKLEAKNADGAWEEIPFNDGFFWTFAIIESPLSFNLPFTGRTIQFAWQVVADATQYRLTQTAGLRYPVVPTAGKIYASDQFVDRFTVPVHLFDWRNARFALHALVDDVWEMVGEQDALYLDPQNSILSSANAIEVYASAGSESAYASSVVLAEDGSTMAVGAFGDSLLPDDFECPADGSGAGAGDGEGPGQGDGSGSCDLGGVLAQSSGAVYVYDVGSRIATKIKAPNFGPGDRFGGAYSPTKPANFDGNDAYLFGDAIAISDDGMTLAISATGEDSSLTGVLSEADLQQDNNDAFDSGAVYVYRKIAGDWVLDAYIKAPNAAPPADGELGDSFGWALALSADGNTLAVSALFEDSDGADPLNDALTDSGAVFVYARAGGLWTEQAYLKASNAGVGDRFGRALAFAEDEGYQYLAVSAYSEDGANGNPDTNSNSGSGAVYVFAGDAGIWQETAYLKASNAGSDDRFGTSIAFDAKGTLLVVGAPQEDRLTDGGLSSPGSGRESVNVGAAYLFERLGSGPMSSWSQNSLYLKPSSDIGLVQFGQAVSVSSSGKYIAVGSWLDLSGVPGVNQSKANKSAFASGATYVFRRTVSNDSWREIAYVKPPAPSRYQFFGSKLDLALDGELMGVTGNGLFPDGAPALVAPAVYLY